MRMRVHRLTAAAPTRPLAWKLPCAAGAALGKKKKKMKLNCTVSFFFFLLLLFRAVPSAYPRSQATCLFRATDSGLQQHHRIRAASSSYTTAHSNQPTGQGQELNLHPHGYQLDSFPLSHDKNSWFVLFLQERKEKSKSKEKAKPLGSGHLRHSAWCPAKHTALSSTTTQCQSGFAHWTSGPGFGSGKQTMLWEFNGENWLYR